MASQLQPSFSSGELTPSAYGRVDLQKYQSGLKTCRNNITRVHGGIVNRPGTELVAEVKDSTKKSRLIPFVFSATQSYVLVFSDFSMLVAKEGGLVLEADQTITATTNATPVVVTLPAHGFVNEDRVFISGTGLASIDNRFWIIGDVGINTFSLLGSTAPGATSATGIAARVFCGSTPYAEAQLPTIKYTQLNDVMTLAHNDVRTKDLSRSGHANWSFADMIFEQGPFQERNVDAAKTVQSSDVTGAVTLTATGHTPFTQAHVGMLFYLEQPDYGKPWEVSKTITIGDIRRSDGKYYRATNSATTGTLRPSHDKDSASDGNVDWLYVHSGYGICLITDFVDSGSVLATVLNELPAEVAAAPSYKWAFGAWGGDQGWPAITTYFQQRKTLATTPTQPIKTWHSGTNAFKFFGHSAPIADDDSFSMTLASNRADPIRHLVSLGKLVALTAGCSSHVRPRVIGGGQWIIPDNDNDPTLTPSKRSARSQEADTILYNSEKGQTVMDMAYQFATNNFGGNDLSVLSKHLFEGHNIVAAAYQHVPFQVDWEVRDDGVLLGMTYLKEHQVWGWHHHDTKRGFFEDVATISEGNEDRAYFLVRRTINGQTKRFIERLASRLYTDPKDAYFVDCGLRYDGRNTGATTMTISGGTNWTIGETFTLTSTPAHFASSDVGSEIHLSEFTLDDDGNEVLSGRILRLVITAYTSPTIVDVQSNRTVAVNLRAVARTQWGHARKVFHVEHLEGETVSILADANVHPQQVVASGIVTLQHAAVVVHIGLPIEADFETLNLNIASAGGLLDKEKATFAVRLMVEKTRGIFAGPDAAHLIEYPQRRDENYDEPVAPLTGLASIRIPARWEPGGRVFIRQSDPLPLSILAVVPDFEMSGSK